MRPYVRLEVYFWITILLLPVAVTDAQAPPKPTCLRMLLHDPPSWVSSGAWSRDSSVLFLVDILNEKLSPISLGGSPLPAIQKIKGIDRFSPSLLKNSSTGFTLENIDGELHWLDDDFHMIRSLNLLGLKNAEGMVIESVWDWADAGRELVAFSDVSVQSGGRGDGLGAFLRIPVEEPSKFETIDWINLEDSGRKLYFLLGHHYFAETNSAAYFVAMRGISDLFEIRRLTSKSPDFPLLDTEDPPPKAYSLTNVLPRFDVPPFIPWDSFKSFRDKYQYLNTVDMLVGIFGRGDSLVALIRQSEHGVTSWLIERIASKADFRQNSTLTLPSTAPNILTFPGAKYWGFLEIGPIEVPGILAVESLLLIPAGWIEESGTAEIVSPPLECAVVDSLSSKP